jgi:hypothetical protein
MMFASVPRASPPGQGGSHCAVECGLSSEELVLRVVSVVIGGSIDHASGAATYSP